MWQRFKLRLDLLKNEIKIRDYLIDSLETEIGNTL